MVRAIGSYPIGHKFESHRRYHANKNDFVFNINIRPVGQAVKTRPFHGCNMGSIPVRVTNEKRGHRIKGVLFFYLVGASSESNPAHIPTSAVIPTKYECKTHPAHRSAAVRYGFATLLRRFRVGSLVWRSKFPYKIPKARCPRDFSFMPPTYFRTSTPIGAILIFFEKSIKF